MSSGERAVGLALGFVADAVFGDPRRGHPVAGFGTLAAGLERRLYADHRMTGAVYTTVLVGAAVAGGAGLDRGRPWWRLAVIAAATWAVLGGSSLAGHGSGLARELAAGDLDAARRRLPSLCGRDPAALDAAGLARAGPESLAENTSDAGVAPLLWGAVGG
ncbi:MAG: cobalamin biosynthesis protein, partial [Pseudonocardia sp.]|nr:cobalamin biosynthesis protein [Pseudonocardia sp.]